MKTPETKVLTVWREWYDARNAADDARNRAAREVVAWARSGADECTVPESMAGSVRSLRACIRRCETLRAKVVDELLADGVELYDEEEFDKDAIDKAVISHTSGAICR